MTWILCYGSNGPRQLCNRIGTPYEQLINRMCPVTVSGYKRGFCNNSPFWENTSPATLYETGDQSDVVEGVALQMTRDEIAALDPYEGYPSWYNRVDMTLTGYPKASEGG